jgi:uncharacterized membrane protein (Fun14 family)
MLEVARAACGKEVLPPLDLTGWYVGYAIASVVIVLVVILVGWILSLASRINQQVTDVIVEITEIQGTTELVPAVGAVNEKLVGIVNSAAAAREALVGE